MTWGAPWATSSRHQSRKRHFAMCWWRGPFIVRPLGATEGCFVVAAMGVGGGFSFVYDWYLGGGGYGAWLVSLI